MGTTTKVFKSGGSQAVRIPKAFRLDVDTVSLERTEGGLVIAAAPAVGKGKASQAAKATARPRRPGFLKGLKVPSDFDAPLPNAVLREFGKP